MKVRSLLITVAILLVAVVILVLISARRNYMQSSEMVRRTDDAYLHADMVSLSTRVTDTLKTLNVGDYQHVHAGEVLAQLEDTDYKAELAEARAGVESARAELADNQAAKSVQAAKIAVDASSIEQAESALTQAETEIAQAAAAALEAAQERQRQTALFAQQASTRQTLEKAVSADDQAQAKVLDAKAAALKAEAAVASSKSALVADRRSLESLQVKDHDYTAAIDAKNAAVRTAEVQLGYTRIVAPMDGEVGERKVFPGQMLSPGVEVLQLVEGDEWVVANFEETQLSGMKVGDAAEVRLDALPGVALHGKVNQIAPASGSQESLLPPDNATGNFTKVIQRVPVKIVLDSSQGYEDRLRPGLSAEVEVWTR